MGVKEYVDCKEYNYYLNNTNSYFNKSRGIPTTELSPLEETEMLLVAVFVCS